MSEGINRIIDRTTMELYFEQKYTRHQKRPALKALILITDFNVEDLPRIVLKRRKLSKQYSVKVVKLGNAFYKVAVQRTIGSQEIKGEIIIDAGCPGAWVILTEGESYFVVHALDTLFDTLYPFISRLYLNYSQMRFLIGILQTACEGKAIQTHYSVKRIHPETHHIGTDILWDRDVENEINNMLSRGFVVKVTRLDFELRDKDNAVLKAQISRKGLCKLKFGSFSSFYHNIVLNIIEYGLSQKKFYDKRERILEKDSISLHPLKIEYDFPLLESQTTRFVKKITRLYSCSVVHGSNPYFVADLCDYQNGASFGIAILGKRVTVTPITKANPLCVWKIMREIQEILGDGEIAEIVTRKT